MIKFSEEVGKVASTRFSNDAIFPQKEADAGDASAESDPRRTAANGVTPSQGIKPVLRRQ